MTSELLTAMALRQVPTAAAPDAAPQPPTAAAAPQARSSLRAWLQKGLLRWPRFTRRRAEADFDLTVPKLRSEAIGVAMHAARTAHAIEGCAKLAEDQSHLAESIENASRETTAAIDHVSDSAQRIASSTEEGLQRARQTAQGLSEAARRIGDVDAGAQSFLATVQQVSERCAEVAQVIDEISRISRQTKILALNAAIEAAHAGAAGKGFAAVALAIRTLADEVSEVTQNCRASVALATTLAAQAAGRTTQVRSDIQGILQTVSTGSVACGHILGDLEGAAGQFTQIAAAAEQMAAANMHVRSSIVQSKRISSEVSARLRSTTESSNALLASTENIQELLGAFEQGQGRFEQLLLRCRGWQQRVEHQLQILASHGAPLFDEDYSLLPGTNPPQHALRYQPAFERAIRPLLDQARAETQALACVCTDRNGYLPTHNSDFCKPPSGDPAIDVRQCRDKRIMRDRHGQRSAQYTGRLLLQTFVRDNGELTVELALPLHVEGRRWGALRFGFAPERVSAAGDAMAAANEQ